MITTMKTNKNYSAHSAWGFGGASETRPTTSAAGTSAVKRAAMTLAFNYQTQFNGGAPFRYITSATLTIKLKKARVA